MPLRLEYDPQLPISAHREEILSALEKHRVIVVCGATGSGKTTQLPKLCLEAGRGALGLIGHTQPRRIAARALANRLAFELGTAVGGAVGYQVRFTDRTGPDCRVKLMTDGILLRELTGDPELLRYDTLIIDEAHERSINIDLLLGVLRGLAERRPELRVIVTSATIDPGKFADFFGGAPIIEVSGRSYPVEVRYRPLVAEDEDAAELSLPEGVVEAVRELDADPRTRGQDILVFLPGEKHIREAAEALQRARLPDTEVLPLFARLSAREQERIFQPHGTRRVVLATNVAETSLTVPGIRHVVDSGLARISRYSVRGKVQRLPIEPISKASADQRKGRCGREAEGVCIRLYSQEDFEAREEFTPPEILRTNLASVILQMAVIGLGEPERFPFLDPPDTRLVNDGVRLLQELRAMDERRRVTRIGRQIASLPVDPRLGRMLLAAARRRCLAEMLVIAAFLEIQDPRERPADAQQQADQQHAQFADSRSDFVAVLNLWRAWQAASAESSGAQLRKWCRERFLSCVRMREWQELHAELEDAVAELGLRPNVEPATYADLHQAILTGFLSSIGRLTERREYEGARGTRFVIAPGTPLAARPPRWVVAASLVETTRLYARMVAAVAPGWIETAGAHLLKRTYDDAHWLESRGYVAAYEAVSLYGLQLAARRRVNFGNIAPDVAREIFVREALVGGRAQIRGEFFTANRKLRAEIEYLEAKIRRRDILVDERTQMDFYLARIPRHISSVPAFERWREEAERREPRLLFMTREDLVRRDAPEVSPADFPDELQVGPNRLPLEYRFEPGAPDDGLTLVVPELLVEELEADRLAWLVPGMRLEKITAVLRALPKHLRRQLVPVPDHAREALAESEGTSAGFYEWMAQWISRRAGEAVTAAALAALGLPDHLRMNFRVVDDAGRRIAESRDLAAIRRRIRALRGGEPAPPARSASDVHRRWDFGELPRTASVERERLHLVVYPALEDRGDGVALVEARSETEAEARTRAGVTRLALLALPQQAKMLRRRIADDAELVLLSQGLPLAKPLPDALTERIFRERFIPDDVPVPRDAAAFERLIDAYRADIDETANRLIDLLKSTLREWRTVRALLAKVRSPVFASAVADIEAQLAGLLAPSFIESTPLRWLEQFPRYLKAVRRRIERLPGNVARDAELAAQVEPFQRALRELEEQSGMDAKRPELEQLRWMIEEFRVSLFAQDLRTVLRVSHKRLAEQLERARTPARG
mgnify:FL=1